MTLHASYSPALGVREEMPAIRSLTLVANGLLAPWQRMGMASDYIIARPSKRYFKKPIRKKTKFPRKTGRLTDRTNTKRIDSWVGSWQWRTPGRPRPRQHL